MSLKQLPTIHECWQCCPISNSPKCIFQTRFDSLLCRALRWPKSLVSLNIVIWVLGILELKQDTVYGRINGISWGWPSFWFIGCVIIFDSTFCFSVVKVKGWQPDNKYRVYMPFFLPNTVYKESIWFIFILEFSLPFNYCHQLCSHMSIL